MKRRILSSLMALVLVFGLLPATAFAEGETVPDGKAKIGNNVYNTLDEAMDAVEEGGTATIYLGKGTYSGNTAKTDPGKGAGKSLTFVGAGTGETTWQIMATEKHGSDGWCDYSFRDSDRITFENMTVVGSVYPDGSTKSNDTQGLTYIQHITLKNCIFNGRADYWGYESTTFENVTFNAPGTEASGVAGSDYALWTYTGKSYTFKNCTFNSAGKTVNVYRQSGPDYDIIVNFEGCTVNNTSSNKAVLNINDSNMGDYKYFLNISGNNTVSSSVSATGNGPFSFLYKTRDSQTCSRLFGYSKEANNTGRTIVKFNGETVWKGGEMVDAKAYHTKGVTVDGVTYDNGGSGAKDILYAEGYKDNAFTTPIYSEWTKNPDGSQSREGTKTCKYCGQVVTFKERKEADPIDWDVPKSKTATQLDTNTWTSDVTLSLPSAEENLASDVVFVLDKSQCRNASATAAQELVSQLLAQQELEKATLKVGVVAFGGTAIVVRDLEEITDAKDLEDAVGDKNVGGLHGTNIHAGLIEADKMLSEDTAVSDNRKYVILISDGHTYEFSHENDEKTTYVVENKGVEFKALPTYGIYSENDLYAYGRNYFGISYTIHSLHDQYYTGDYDKESGNHKDGWSGSYLTDAKYKTGKPGDSDEVGNIYEMPYGTWDKYLAHITEVVKADDGKYDVQLTYDGGDYGNQCIGNLLPDRAERAALADSILGQDNYIKCGLDADGKDNQLMHASGVDRAVYEAYTKYDSMAKKYHCYPIYVNRAGAYDRALTTQDYGYQLMHALGAISNNTGTDVSVPNAPVAENIDNEKFNGIFNGIKNDILYAVSAGSTVTDTIGKKFTLYDVKSFTLKVGGTDVTGTVNGNTVNFGNPKSDGSYPYTVTYTPAAKTFVWTINENVSNFAPVQLTYTVKLSEPETTPGTHGVEDLNGEKKLSNAEAEKALFTNESAVLNAKNSAGVPVEEQVFLKPSVSYTISSGTGGDDGDDDNYFFAIQKVDAQDGHALNGAKFGLYLDGKQVATATSNRSGIAMFRVNESDYRKINAKSDLYYQELTAPEGYVVNSDEVSIKKSNLTTSWSKAEKDAETVRNYRGVTPDLLNDSDHFAYVIGYMDGNVRPYGLISRAETTTIFFRLLKDSVRDGNLLTSNTYTDVPDDYWANTAISTMTGLGIVQGRSTTTFDPKAPITRAQFAAICARFDTGKSNGEQTFSDIQGHWAEKYIERAAELGWIKGFEDGTFRPDTYITRAQAMTMINRVLNRIPEDESDLLPGMNVWPDCNPGDWFYLAVQEATNSHDFKHKAGNYETWTGMNKDPDWTRYEH